MEGIKQQVQTDVKATDAVGELRKLTKEFVCYLGQNTGIDLGGRKIGVNKIANEAAETPDKEGEVKLVLPPVFVKDIENRGLTDGITLAIGTSLTTSVIYGLFRDVKTPLSTEEMIIIMIDTLSSLNSVLFLNSVKGDMYEDVRRFFEEDRVYDWKRFAEENKNDYWKMFAAYAINTLIDGHINSWKMITKDGEGELELRMRIKGGILKPNMRRYDKAGKKKAEVIEEGTGFLNYATERIKEGEKMGLNGPVRNIFYKLVGDVIAGAMLLSSESSKPYVQNAVMECLNCFRLLKEEQTAYSNAAKERDRLNRIPLSLIDPAVLRDARAEQHLQEELACRIRDGKPVEKKRNIPTYPEPTMTY